MAFWNQKKTESTSVRPTVSTEIFLELQKAVRESTHSGERNTAQIVRSNQELIKALNTATKEYKRSKS